MKNPLFPLFLLLICFFSTIQTEAQDIPDRPAKYTPVLQKTLTLNPSEVSSLESRLKTYFDSTSTQICVVIINSTGNKTIEAYANELFNSWGIGQKGQDNGLLLLIAVDDHKMRLEVGYELEAYLPDQYCKGIIEEILKPRFRNNNFHYGINEAIDLIISRLSGNDAQFIKLSKAGAEPYKLPYPFFFVTLSFLAPAFVLILLLLQVRKRLVKKAAEKPKKTRKTKKTKISQNKPIKTHYIATFCLFYFFDLFGCAPLIALLIKDVTSMDIYLLFSLIMAPLSSIILLLFRLQTYENHVLGDWGGGGSTSDSSSGGSSYYDSGGSSYSDSFGGGSSGGGGASGGW